MRNAGEHERRLTLATVVARLILLLAGACGSPVHTGEEGRAEPPPDDEAYMDPDLSTSERVNDLIDRMTLDAKLGQITRVDRAFLSSADEIGTYTLGSILSGGGSAPDENSPDERADMHDTFQRQAIDTRLGMPLLYGTDAVHGHNNLRDATFIPPNIGFGATRNPELIEDVHGEIISTTRDLVESNELPESRIDDGYAEC